MEEEINRDERLRERIATLEASARYHADSLSEISKTLKEVVKVQGMLASQRDEIIKISDSLTALTAIMHEQDKALSSNIADIARHNAYIAQLQLDVSETTKTTRDNARFVKNSMWAVGTVLLPILFIVIKTFI